MDNATRMVQLISTVDRTVVVSRPGMEFVDSGWQKDSLSHFLLILFRIFISLLDFRI